MTTLPSRRSKQPVEQVAVSPFHHAGLQADGRPKSGNHATLRLQQAWQLLDENRHFGPLAEPDFLRDLEKTDGAHKNGVSRIDGRQGTWR